MIDENNPDDFTELERELRGLRPKGASTRLMMALAGELESESATMKGSREEEAVSQLTNSGSVPGISGGRRFVVAERAGYRRGKRDVLELLFHARPHGGDEAPPSRLVRRGCETASEASPSNGLPIQPSFMVRWLLPVAAALVVGVLAVRLPKANSTLVTAPASGSALAPASATARNSREASPVLYKPMSVEKLRYGDREETFVTLADGTPARQLRDRYLDTITWHNPRTNASLTWSIPREEIRVIPITAY